MPYGVDVGDAGPNFQQAASEARQIFEQGEQGQAAAPAFAPAPALKEGRAPIKPKGSAAEPPPPKFRQGAPALPTDTATPTDLPHQDLSGAPPPPPPDFGAQAAAENTVGGALGTSTAQLGKEIGYGAARGALWLAKGLGFAGAALASGAESEAAGYTGEAPSGAAPDQVFQFLHDHVDTAMDKLQIKPGETNPYAHVAGKVAEAGAPLLVAAPLGATAGIAAFAGAGAAQAGQESIDRNEDATTATTLALVAATTNALFGKVPLHNANVVKRIASAVGVGVPISVASDTLTKIILKDRGYQKAADDINPLDPTSIAKSGLMQVIFGIIAGPKAQKIIKENPDATTQSSEGAPPPPGPAGGSAVEPPPPPVAPVSDTTSPAGQAGVHAPDKSITVNGPGGAIPDNPTPESARDIRAQIVDMNDKATPRSGVLITKDTQTILAGSKDANAASVNGTLNQAKSQGRTIDLPTGTLMLKTKSATDAAQKRLAAGEDPQAVIGSVTGAGNGKAPENTVVVQGHTPTGAVATETTVPPEGVAIAAQKAVDQGKTPVVTSPEDALARRMNTISEERNAPTQMGIMTTESGKQVPVHVESGAPAGQTRVRALDAEGEPTEKTVDVPSDRVKVTKPQEEAATKTPPPTEPGGSNKGEGLTPKPATEPVGEEAPAKAKVEANSAESTPPEGIPASEETSPQPVEQPKIKAVAPKSALDVLPEALSTHESQEEIPDGKKFAAPLAERQDNASAFATVLKEAAKEAAGTDIDPGAISRANAASRAAERLTEKGKAATDKGQGTGHTKVTALVAEMHKAARLLLGEGKPGDDVKISPKEAELKMRVARKAANVESPVYYHGSREPVGRFDLSKYKTGDLVGHYFSETEDGAKKWAEFNSQGKGDVNTISAKLDLKNPAGFKDASAAKKELGADWTPKHLTDALKAKGFDGYKDENETVVFSSEQVKRIQKPTVEPSKIEVPVNEKYKDQVKQPVTKPPATDVQRKRTAERMLTEYVHADEEDAPKVRDKIEQWLHEEMSDEYTPDQMRQVLHLLDDQRRIGNPNAGKKLSMSETVEAEQHEFDTARDDMAAQGMSRGGKELLSRQQDTELKPLDKLKLRSEWNHLADRMVDSDDMQSLEGREDTGRPIGSHQLMDTMIGNAKSPILKYLMTSVRQHVPDYPVYIMSEPRDLTNGKSFGHSAAGLFHPDERVIQITASKANPVHTLQVALHEITHGATAYELNNNPHGELARELENARQILVNRLKSMYGEESIKAHEDYFDDTTGTVPKPVDYMRHLYGIKNVHELLSEGMGANPRFMQEIADSEAWASPKEEAKYGMTSGRSLMGKIFDAIARFFGVSDARLMKHIAVLGERVMETQAEKVKSGAYRPLGLDKTNEQFATGFENLMKTRLGLNPMEIRKSFPTMMALREEPPPVRGSDKDIRDTVGDEATHIARAFNWATKNRAIDMARTVKTSLKTVAQIFRDHRSDFGNADDPANPLNKLEDVDASKNVIINKLGDIARPVAEKWLKLSEEESRAVGQLQIDSTMYKIDPRKAADKQPQVAQNRTGFAERHAEYQARLAKLSDSAQEVFGDSIDAYAKIAKEHHKAGVDTALTTFGADVTDAQKSLLYSVRNGREYDDLIGKDKLIDVGDQNDKLVASLKDLAGASRMEGPYAHLGRHGDYVVAAKPEGTREFTDRSKAEEFVDNINNLSPDSKAEISERGGKFAVDYKARYVSMHESRLQAEEAAKRMTDAGLDVGMVTQKTLTKNDTPLGAGARDLIAAAESKINRGGHDKGTEALIQSLRSAFLQVAAARSAYAGSRLARQNFAGVKAEDMRRNFSEYTTSTAWHTAQMRTVFDQASALARLRDMARDAHDPNATQATIYRRGEVMSALNSHMQDEVQNFGHKSPLNSGLAKLGFMSYLASPAHAFIWMTQNFTTGYWRGGAKWGYGKSAAGFYKGMKAVAAPSFRSTMSAVFKRGGTASDVHSAIIEAVRKDPEMGKWAKGTNSPLQQLIDRGVISHSYSNELSALARGDSALVARAFEWARLLPNMADAFNRVSTALAGLEMTGGDIRKTRDFVDEVHADYSQANKPLAFKKIGRMPGMNSVTMFTTYRQAMAHLLYGNLVDSFQGEHKAESAKTVAGMVLGNAIFAGVYGSVALEPLRLAIYAYHKIFDKEGEVYDLKNQIHNFLVKRLGKQAGEVAAGGLPRALGFDLSTRMGLSDLFFHDPPDLLTSDPSIFGQFLYKEAGPMASFLAERTAQFTKHMQNGEQFQAISSLIPIKMYQDAVKATQLGATGKENSLGEGMTKPSAMDAAFQAFGLKPASVAEAQERSETVMNYKQQVGKVRDNILKAYASGDKKAALERVQSFNKLHPAEAIRGEDLIKEMVKQQKSGSNFPQRDPQLQKMLNP